jgi:hypothetical protein
MGAERIGSAIRVEAVAGAVTIIVNTVDTISRFSMGGRSACGRRAGGISIAVAIVAIDKIITIVIRMVGATCFIGSGGGAVGNTGAIALHITVVSRWAGGHAIAAADRLRNAGACSRVVRRGTHGAVRANAQRAVAHFTGVEGSVSAEVGARQ